MDLYLSALPKGSKESNGFPDAEPFAKSFLKIKKKNKYLEVHPAVNREIFFWLSQKKTFLELIEKKNPSVVNYWWAGNYSTISVITKIYIILNLL